MEYRKLGQTGLDVSAICLGTMTWGEQNTEAEGHQQMDYALDQGVNFIDTAELYPIPPKAETRGRTEKIIGTWLGARKNRDKVILATKMVGRTVMNWFRADGSLGRVTREQVNEAVDRSLKSLQTDYIDLYQIHWPDRPTKQFGSNPVIYDHQEGEGTPFEEQLEFFQDMVKAGKIRHFGLSNENAYGAMSFLGASKGKDLPRVQSIQNAYHLANRTYESSLAEMSLLEQVSLLAYSPLAQGFLTGKYQNGAVPAGTRKALFERLGRYETPGADAAFQAYVDLAAKMGLDPAQMAIRFVLSKPFVTSAIIGATSLEQLKTDIAAHELPWNDELDKAVDAIHLLHTNPCP